MRALLVMVTIITIAFVVIVGVADNAIAQEDNETMTDGEVIQMTGEGVSYFFMGLLGIYGLISGIRLGASI